MKDFKYNIGDKVKIRIWKKSDGWLYLIRDGDFYYPEDTTIHEALAIGRDSGNGELQCLCDFDPHSYMSYNVSWWHVTMYDIDGSKWDNEKACSVPQSYVYDPEASNQVEQVHLNNPGGTNCKLCNRFFQYAENNRDDYTFVCFKCMQTKSYLLKCNPI